MLSQVKIPRSLLQNQMMNFHSSKMVRSSGMIDTFKITISQFSLEVDSSFLSSTSIRVN